MRIFDLLKKTINIFKNQGVKGLIRVVLAKLESTQWWTIPRVWDRYMDWLVFTNAGMLLRGNIDCFDYAIKNIPSDAPIVEIGSFCGLSTNMLTHCKERNNAKNKLISCDKWITEPETEGMLDGSWNISREEYRAFIIDTYIRNIKMFSRYDLPYTIAMLSDDFFSAWNDSKQCVDVLGRTITLGGPISFCYIDGNHTYPFVKRDFINVDAFLEVGGFILFDDSADEFSCFEVGKVVQEVIRTKRYKVIAKNPNYFLKKMEDKK